MSEKGRTPTDILASAGFTEGELTALVEELFFKIAFADDGEPIVVAGMGAGTVDWTPQKTQAFTEYIKAIRQQSL